MQQLATAELSFQITAQTSFHNDCGALIELWNKHCAGLHSDKLQYSKTHRRLFWPENSFPLIKLTVLIFSVKSSKIKCYFKWFSDGQSGNLNQIWKISIDWEVSNLFKLN